MKRKTFFELAVLAVLGIGTLGVFFVWGMIASAERARLTPSPTATTLQTFADSMPPPSRLGLVILSGETHLVWTGDVAYWSLLSGPACYVFDSSGKLIQWDLSTGDGEPTTEILSSSYYYDEMTLDEALDFVADK